MRRWRVGFLRAFSAFGRVTRSGPEKVPSRIRMTNRRVVRRPSIQETRRFMKSNSHERKSSLLGWILVVMTIAACGVVPGPPLEGSLREVPESWAFVDSDALCQLEVDSSAPRSVTVGCYAVDGVLHIHSHRWASAPRIAGESWTTTVDRDPNVRVLLDESLYAMQIVPVVDASTRRAILADRGFDPVPDGIRVFRLIARD